jgi:hypothetical protein
VATLQLLPEPQTSRSSSSCTHSHQASQQQERGEDETSSKTGRLSLEARSLARLVVSSLYVMEASASAPIMNMDMEVVEQGEEREEEKTTQGEEVAAEKPAVEKSESESQPPAPVLEQVQSRTEESAVAGSNCTQRDGEPSVEASDEMAVVEFDTPSNEEKPAPLAGEGEEEEEEESNNGRGRGEGGGKMVLGEVHAPTTSHPPVRRHSSSSSPTRARTIPAPLRIPSARPQRNVNKSPQSPPRFRHDEHNLPSSPFFQKPDTHYPYRPPRVDPVLYQVDVPDLVTGREKGHARDSDSSLKSGLRHRPSRNSEGLADQQASSAADAPSLRPGQLSLEENRVWKPDAASSAEVRRFLLFGRNLASQTSAEDPLSFFKWDAGIGCESDEQLLEVLHRHGGDVQHAEFDCGLRVCRGTAVRSMEVAEHGMGTPQHQLLAWQSRFKRRVAALGSFRSSNPYLVPYPLPGSLCRSTDGAGDVPGDLSSTTTGSGGGTSAASPDTERGRRGADRAEFKSRWKSIQTVTQSLLSHSTPSSSKKPSLSACMDVLNDAASLPTPEQSPGDDWVPRLQTMLTSMLGIVSKTRSWTSRVVDELTSHEEVEPGAAAHYGITVSEAKALLSEARHLPLTTYEQPMLAAYVARAESWEAKAQAVLHTCHKGAAKSSSRRPSKSIMDLKTLLDEAKSIPLSLKGEPAIRECLGKAVALASRVRTLLPVTPLPDKEARATVDVLEGTSRDVEKLGVWFPEMDILKAELSTVRKFVTAAEQALSGKISLKDLHNLLASCSQLPCNVTPWETKLATKLDKATEWLTKVKSAFPKSRSTRRDGQTSDKVVLADVKGLLNQQEENGVCVDVKELTRISDLVETAEEWMSRVRDVLDGGEDASFQALTDLLKEADDIPVTMDEQQVLTVGIKARQWKIRVSEALAPGAPPLSLSSLRGFAQEASLLRAMFPASARSGVVYAMLEESSIVCLLEEGNKWADLVANLNSDLQHHKAVSMARVQDLIESSRTVALDLSQPVGKLKELLLEMRSWIEDNSATLKACGVDVLGAAAMDVEDEVGSDASRNEPTGGDQDHYDRRVDRLPKRGKAKEGEDCKSLASHLPPGGPKLTLENLHACVQSADKLSFGKSLIEAQLVRKVYQKVSEWMEHTQQLCPRRHSKRRISPSSKTPFDDVYRALNQSETFPVDLHEEVNRLTVQVMAAHAWTKKAEWAIGKVLGSLARSTRKRLAIWSQEKNSSDEKATENAAALSEKKKLKTDGSTGSDSAVGADGAEPLSVGNSEGPAAASEPAEVSAGSEKGPTAAADEGEAKCDWWDEDETEAEEEEDETEVGQNAEAALDKAEQRYRGVISDMLESARDIEFFIAAEVVCEQLIDVFDWIMDIRSLLHLSSSSKNLPSLADVKAIQKMGDKVRSIEKHVSIMRHRDNYLLGAVQFILGTYSSQIEPITNNLIESEKWAARVKTMLEGDKASVAELRSIMKESASLALEHQELKKKLKAEVQRCSSWLTKARSALNGPQEKRLPLPAIKKLIADGDKVRGGAELLKQLKAEAKAATRWLSQVKKTGLQQGTATLAELKPLIPVALQIKVDLSEELKVLQAAVATICICRKAPSDFVITCSVCSEKYHGTCIEVRKESVERDPNVAAEYICILCRNKSLNERAEIEMRDAFARWLPYAEGFKPSATKGDNFSALAKVIHDALQLPHKDIRTNFQVFGEVSSNIDALRLLPWPSGPDGEHQFKEAQIILQCLRILLWTGIFHWMFRGRPFVSVALRLLKEMPDMPIVDEEFHAALERITLKCTKWREDARALLRPPQGSAREKAMDVNKMKVLLQSTSGLSLQIPEENMIQSAYDDSGARYCICRGANDGTWMVGCDTCDDWFHGRCVNFTVSDIESGFLCPYCSEKTGKQYAFGKPVAREPTNWDTLRDTEVDEANARSLPVLWPSKLVLDYLDAVYFKPPPTPPSSPPVEGSTGSKWHPDHRFVQSMQSSPPPVTSHHGEHHQAMSQSHWGLPPHVMVPYSSHQQAMQVWKVPPNFPTHQRLCTRLTRLFPLRCRSQVIIMIPTGILQWRLPIQGTACSATPITDLEARVLAPMAMIGQARVKILGRWAQNGTSHGKIMRSTSDNGTEKVLWHLNGGKVSSVRIQYF